jgi:hypothetical protein
MAACDDVQVSVEMLHNGATPLVPEAEARAHAATCATCAAYAAMLKETKLMMKTSDLSRRDGFDANAVLTKTLSEIPSRRDVWKLVGFVVVALIGVFAYLRVTGRDEILGPRLIGMLGVMGGVCIAAFAYRHSRYRVWATYAGKPIEILAARRTELEQRVRLATIAMPLFAALVAHNAYNGYVRESLLRLGLAVAYTFLLCLFIRNTVASRRELRELAPR